MKLRSLLPWWYQLAYALVNWFEATASLLCLGYWYPTWTVQFACWATARHFNR